jgi:hypothetical protein
MLTPTVLLTASRSLASASPRSTCARRCKSCNSSRSHPLIRYARPRARQGSSQRTISCLAIVLRRAHVEAGSAALLQAALLNPDGAKILVTILRTAPDAVKIKPDDRLGPLGMMITEAARASGTVAGLPPSTRPPLPPTLYRAAERLQREWIARSSRQRNWRIARTIPGGAAVRSGIFLRVGPVARAVFSTNEPIWVQARWDGSAGDSIRCRKNRYQRQVPPRVFLPLADLGSGL